MLQPVPVFPSSALQCISVSVYQGISLLCLHVSPGTLKIPHPFLFDNITWLVAGFPGTGRGDSGFSAALKAAPRVVVTC